MSVGDYYGFGVVDAKAAGQAAKTWENFSPEKHLVAGSQSAYVFIPDDESKQELTPEEIENRRKRNAKKKAKQKAKKAAAAAAAAEEDQQQEKQQTSEDNER